MPSILFLPLSQEERELITETILSLGADDEETVHVSDDFGRMMSYFGPIDDKMLERMKKLRDAPWFHGLLATDADYNRLKQHSIHFPKGLFLVRFSSEFHGNFTACLRQGQCSAKIAITQSKQDGKTTYLLRCNSEKGGDVTVANVFEAVEQLIVRYGTGLSPCPKETKPSMMYLGSE
eukprot:TRINITY_DN13192_c0_g1_i1.p1 TRINITY_DN13192_c0_g1~~TRINITY_DN13192_c0_g1_i1.p1  ORF type:complete len:178 (-),score=54.56 TRINITY_DN13192_c0_g1_i1:70-603(-)